MDYKKLMGCMALSLAMVGYAQEAQSEPEQKPETVTAKVSLTQGHISTQEEYQFDARCFHEVSSYFWEPTTWMKTPVERERAVKKFEQSSELKLPEMPTIGRQKEAGSVIVSENQGAELIDTYRVMVRYTAADQSEKPLMVSQVLLWDFDGDKSTVEAVGALIGTSRREQWQINDEMRAIRDVNGPIAISDLASQLNYFRILTHPVRVRD